MFFKTAIIALALTAISGAISTIQDRASNPCGTSNMAGCASPEAASKLTGGLMSHVKFTELTDYYDVSVIDGFNVPNQQWCNQQPICCTENTNPGQALANVGVTCVPLTGAVPTMQKRLDNQCGIGDEFGCLDPSTASEMTNKPMSPLEFQSLIAQTGAIFTIVSGLVEPLMQDCDQQPTCCSSHNQNGKIIIDCLALSGLF